MVLARMIGLTSEESNEGECNKELKEPQTKLNKKINKIQLHEEDELLDKVVSQPIITIQIGNEQKTMKSLIDMGLDCNTISQDKFDQLKGASLQPTNTILRSFTTHTIKPKGTSKLAILNQ